MSDGYSGKEKGLCTTVCVKDKEVSLDIDDLNKDPSKTGWINNGWELRLLLNKTVSFAIFFCRHFRILVQSIFNRVHAHAVHICYAHGQRNSKRNESVQLCSTSRSLSYGFC